MLTDQSAPRRASSNTTANGKLSSRLSKPAPAPALTSAYPKPRIPLGYEQGAPITVPQHSWLTSPARSFASSSQGRELPLQLIQLILEHLDDAADLARVTRTSRLFYYMTLPRLYQTVALRSYQEIRYVGGRPEGFGGGSPFAMGLNTLVTRTFTEYVQTFRVTGEWREHDLDDYSRGRVPDNSMMLQVAVRAAMDKMKNLTAFAWELNIKPLSTVYQSLMNRPALTSLTLRCPTKRMPCPTTTIPPIPNLLTLIVYDIDPLCYPDDISVVLATAKNLQNLKLHWNPRMRESGEESINLLTYFARVIAGHKPLPVKRFATYNLYARNTGDGFEQATDPMLIEEMTMINSMGTTEPLNIFLDNTWRTASHYPVPHHLKMLRVDHLDKELVHRLSRINGLERFYVINKPRSSKPSCMAATPTTPSNGTPTVNGASAATTPTMTESSSRSLAGGFLAVVQSNHSTMKHLLLSDQWQLTENALYKICQNCSDLEQLGFSFSVPPLESLRQIISLVPKLSAIRILVRLGSEFAEMIDSVTADVHEFMIATEFWHPAYKNIRYIGMGDKLIYKLGEVVYPAKSPTVTPGQENSMNTRRKGPMRNFTRMSREEVSHVEIWGMDTTEFVPTFP